MDSKTVIIGAVPLLIYGAIMFFSLKKENRKQRKYFGLKVKQTKKEVDILQKYKTEYLQTPDDVRLPTIARDKYVLDDIAKSATEIIYETPIPTPEEKQGLKPGDQVKLVFNDESNIGERMWVNYIGDEDGLLKGTLANSSFDVSVNDLIFHNIIYFHPNHILAIDKKQT